jgi:hypothetical protein
MASDTALCISPRVVPLLVPCWARIRNRARGCGALSAARNRSRFSITHDRIRPEGSLPLLAASLRSSSIRSAGMRIEYTWNGSRGGRGVLASVHRIDSRSIASSSSVLVGSAFFNHFSFGTFFDPLHSHRTRTYRTTSPGQGLLVVATPSRSGLARSHVAVGHSTRDQSPPTTYWSWELRSSMDREQLQSPTLVARQTRADLDIEQSLSVCAALLLRSIEFHLSLTRLPESRGTRARDQCITSVIREQLFRRSPETSVRICMYTHTYAAKDRVRSQR